MTTDGPAPATIADSKVPADAVTSLAISSSLLGSGVVPYKVLLGVTSVPTVRVADTPASNG